MRIKYAFAMIAFLWLLISILPLQTAVYIRNNVYIAHDPIVINNNSEFDFIATSEGWTGNGSQENPYIIENYEITPPYNGAGIYIGNTTKYFIIRNCYIHSVYSDRGIYLRNVYYGTLYNNTLQHLSYGIHLENSYSNRIIQNFVDGCQYGVYISFSFNNIFYNNTFEKSGFYFEGFMEEIYVSQEIAQNNTVNGKPVVYLRNVDMANTTINQEAGQIILGNVSNIEINRKTFENVSAGIIVGYCKNVCIQDVNFRYVSGFGIYGMCNIKLQITDCTFRRNGGGIALESLFMYTQSFIEISHCTFSENTRYHMYAFNLNYLTIRNSTFEGLGLNFGHILNFTFENNTFRNSQSDLTIQFCDHVEFTRNVIENVYYGVKFINVGNSTIARNSIINTTFYDLRILNGCFNITIYGNVIENGSSGIIVDRSEHNRLLNNTLTFLPYAIWISSSYNTIKNNTINHCSYGIYLANSHHNIIAGNHLNDTWAAGIYLGNSKYNKIYNNIMENSSIFLTGNMDTYTTQEIAENNTVGGKPILYYKNIDGNGLVVSENAGELIVGNVTNLTISSMVMKYADYSILLGYSKNITLRNIDFLNNHICIYMEQSTDCIIDYCSLMYNSYGLYLDWYSNRNTITNSYFYQNSVYAIYIYSGNYNIVFNNSFYFNHGSTTNYDPSHIQCYDSGVLNSWNYSHYGNYWHDWISPDNDGNGIVDSPYLIDGSSNAKDYYPRTEPLVIEIPWNIILLLSVLLCLIVIAARRRTKKKV